MAVDRKWMRDASDELAVREGCWFDAAAGEMVCDFIEEFCRQSKGRWRGKPIELLDWQRDFLMRLFGWKRADGTRRYRRAFLEVAKKNGKSTMVSALLVALLLLDGEGAPEVYANATDRHQADIVFEEARRMVLASPSLSSRLVVTPSRGTIVHPENDGRIQKNSADVGNKDGVNASAWIFDELHRFKSRDLYDVFRYAGASREQPLEISITTAGEDADGVWYELREYSEQVSQGLAADTAHLGVVYRADPADDLDDPATWRKANPSMGVTIKEEDFRREFEEAKAIPSTLANFKRLRLGIIAGGDSKFVSPEAWKACGVEAIRPPARRACYLGLDMSNKIDLTALVAIFPDDDGTFDLVPWFWIPSEGLADKERRDRATYRAWADAGHLSLCGGSEIDYAAVKNRILRCRDEFDVRGLGGDPWNVKQLLQELQEEEGMEVVEVRQGFASLSAPTKIVEGLLASRRLRHGNHPLLGWCFSNAVCQRDDNENIRLNKRKSRQKIDGASASVNGFAAYDFVNRNDEGPSVYESRGLLVL